VETKVLNKFIDRILGNKVGAEGAKYFAEMLSHNKTLEIFDIWSE
jgi:hypothetical protein